MPRKDLHNCVKGAYLHVGQVTGDTNTLHVDLKGFESCEIFVAANMTTADASNYITPVLYESDVAPSAPTAAASYSAVASADMVGSFSALDDVSSEDPSCQSVGYIGGQRYLYIKLDETGTADGEIAVIAVGSHSVDEPCPTLTTGAAPS